jgi:BirA family biotin operon repressor/biotin-[acetyl-CoA-carboxylase] ligase
MPETLASSPLSIREIRRRLETSVIGQHLYLFDQVESTNASLDAIARAGGRAGTVLVADSQTDGRGRRGQSWFSPAGVNLYVSALFRPRFAPREAGRFSFVASLAVSDAVRELGVHPAIKWPNDVLLGRKKIAGALVECATRAGEVDFLILGVGVNLNVQPAALRDALGGAAAGATSVAHVLGREIDRNAFAASYLNHLDRWAGRYHGEGPDAVVAAWRDRDILTGRRVEIHAPTGAVEGRALGVDPDGHLVVEDANGRRQIIVSADVRLLD